jgi:hypothetical protein
MFLQQMECSRTVRLRDDNQKTRDFFVAGPELEMEWDEVRRIVFLRRIVRPFGFEKHEGEVGSAAEKKARAKAPRKVLAIVPESACFMWPADE